MKSNAEFTQEIIRKTKQQRKKRRILFSVVACCIVSALSFFIGYSPFAGYAGDIRAGTAAPLPEKL